MFNDVITLEIYVSGKVQGVFFRQFTKNQALNLGLNGYVCNISDGRVKIIVQGKESVVGQLLNILSIGPQMSRVDNVERKRIQTNDQFINFIIRY